MTKIQRKRLTILRNFLRNLKLKKGQKFDMWTWGTHSAKSKPTARMCGTAACAAGWATTIPAFNKAGLKLKWPKTPEWNFVGNRFEAYITKGNAVAEYDGTYSHSMDTLEKFFGTSEPFDPNAYPDAYYEISPSVVADRIDEILAHED